jgi:hypothetical protein
MRRSMRLIAALLVVGAVGFGASAALGTTGSSAAGSLSFSITAPDSATKGQLVPWSGSITNNGNVQASAMVWVSVTGPLGGSMGGATKYAIQLSPGQSVSRSGAFKLPLAVPSGAYTVTLNVSTSQASGQASAQGSVS